MQITYIPGWVICPLKNVSFKKIVQNVLFHYVRYTENMKTSQVPGSFNFDEQVWHRGEIPTFLVVPVVVKIIP